MWKGLTLSCLTKTRIRRENISVNAVCRDTKEGSYLKGANPNAKGCWKDQQKLSCLSQTTVSRWSTFRDIRQLRVFVEKASKLRTTQRWKLHRKRHAGSLTQSYWEATAKHTSPPFSCDPGHHPEGRTKEGWEPTSPTWQTKAALDVTEDWQKHRIQ